MKILYLDFDGVLHNDAVMYSEKQGIYIDAPGRKLFEWSHILEKILEKHDDVNIVLSTSWCRVRSYEFAKSQLSKELQKRVIGATFDNRLIQKLEFDCMSRGEQILADVVRREVQGWIAIDNDAKNWPKEYLSNLVKTDDRKGISDIKIQEEIAEKLSIM